MNHLLALALLTLFTAFKVKTGLVQLRPFDGLVILMFVLTLLNRNIRVQDRLPAGFLILLPYFFWHTFSALTVGLENGLREGTQIAIVTVFAFTLADYINIIIFYEKLRSYGWKYPTNDYGRFGSLFGDLKHFSSIAIVILNY